MLLPLLRNVIMQKRGPYEKRPGDWRVLADSRWKKLLKALGKLLGIAKRVQVSCWEMTKGYWKVGQFLRGTGKPLGNSQILA
jgi:hypothetical protein